MHLCWLAESDLLILRSSFPGATSQWRERPSVCLFSTALSSQASAGWSSGAAANPCTLPEAKCACYTLHSAPRYTLPSDNTFPPAFPSASYIEAKEWEPYWNLGPSSVECVSRAIRGNLQIGSSSARTWPANAQCQKLLAVINSGGSLGDSFSCWLWSAKLVPLFCLPLPPSHAWMGSVIEAGLRPAETAHRTLSLWWCGRSEIITFICSASPETWGWSPDLHW